MIQLVSCCSQSTRLGMAKKLAAKAVTKGSKTARGAHDASVEVVTGPRAAKMEAVVNLHDTVEDNQKDDEDDDFGGSTWLSHLTVTHYVNNALSVRPGCTSRRRG